jgi:uncharacterized protein YutE (UPF0331/DUF86 family)
VLKVKKMIDDVIINKVESIYRCIRRIREKYSTSPSDLQTNITKQDSIVLNLQRACELSIGLAMQLIRKFSLGIPNSSIEAFET